MVLHYLDRAHIFMAYAVGGYAVFATEQVGAFDIELVYILALILYLAVVGDINTWHTFQHIADRAVLLLGETSDIVGDGVALFSYAVGLDCHLFEQGGSRLHIDGQWKTHAVKRDGLFSEAHHGNFQTATVHRRYSDSETSV